VIRGKKGRDRNTFQHIGKIKKRKGGRENAFGGGGKRGGKGGGRRALAQAFRVPGASDSIILVFLQKEGRNAVCGLDSMGPEQKNFTHPQGKKSF